MKNSLLVLLFSLTLLACQRQHGVVVNQNVRPRSAVHVLKQNEKKWLHYHHVGMKVDGQYELENEGMEFKCNIRMSHDSILWVSITPLGIEMMRAVITPDSIKALSKIPDNKFGYRLPSADIQEMMGFTLDLNDIQDLLVGIPLGIDRVGGKFKSDIENNELYVISSRYKRKIRKNLDPDNTKNDPIDSLELGNLNEKEKKRMERWDEEDLIVSRYWFDSQQFFLTKCVFNDLMHHRTVHIEYLDWFTDDNNQSYPKQGKILVQTEDKTAQFSWEITKLVYEKTFEFPFEFPADLEIKTKL